MRRVSVEWRVAISFCAACLAIFSGCGDGTRDSGTARPSVALVAEGSRAIIKKCKLDKRIAVRVRFFQRRAHELLEYRLGGRYHVASAPQGPSSNRVFLYNFGSGAVSERTRGGRVYCPRR